MEKKEKEAKKSFVPALSLFNADLSDELSRIKRERRLRAIEVMPPPHWEVIKERLKAVN